MGKGVPRKRPPFFRTKKVAVLGSTGSLKHAPFFDKSWTLIAHPCTKKDLPVKPDWWMDMHPPGNFRQGKEWSPAYYSWLKRLTEPIFMQEDWPDIPMAVRYPKERILAEMRPYFSNHVAWMAALAPTEGVTHFGLFGCEYKHEMERGKQRGSCEYWIGYLDALGIKVVLPPGYSLCNDPPELYGYDSHNADGTLKDSYKTKKKADGVKDPELPKPLTIIDPQSANGRPKLAQLPEGEQPAWERSPWRELVHA